MAANGLEAVGPVRIATNELGRDTYNFDVVQVVRKTGATGAATGGDRGNPRGQGGQGGSGLFNPDGSPRLADDSFKPRFPDPYKEGTWLKRPSLGYRGTMFDGIWRPPENLLQEWVRRGIKELSIPIPGTGLKLKCVVSLLQFGGGCFPVNPDANEQPAREREAPDIPFKPELQEDNGSAKPAG